MEDINTINKRRRQLARSLIAANAGLVVKRAELKRATDRENDARRLRLATAGRLADAQRHASEVQTAYTDACAALAEQYRTGSDVPDPLPLSPSTPTNAYDHPHYPTTYEGYATMETFSIAQVIDNTPALQNDLYQRYQLASGDYADLYPHTDKHGHATPQALDLYGPLITAALEQLRRMREPIDLARVDLDDLILSWEHGRSDYLREQETEPAPEL